MSLSEDQRVEMHIEKRRLHQSGDASGAASIAIALFEDRYFLGLELVTEPEIEAPKVNAKKTAWVKYALAVSNFDSEIINNATRKDIIGMLDANGLLPE